MPYNQSKALFKRGQEVNFMQAKERCKAVIVDCEHDRYLGWIYKLELVNKSRTWLRECRLELAREVIDG